MTRRTNYSYIIVFVRIVFVHEGTSTGLIREKVCNNPSQYGFVQRKGTNKYYLVSDLLLNWFEGEMLCQSIGAHLPSVEDLEENMYLRGIVKDFTKLSSDIKYGMYWLGGYLSKPSNIWKWSDGKPFVFKNFKDNESNYKDGNGRYLTDVYAHLQETFIGWNDSSKEQYDRAVVCKLECYINMSFVYQRKNIEKDSNRNSTDNGYRVNNTEFLTLKGFSLFEKTEPYEYHKGEMCWKKCFEDQKCVGTTEYKHGDKCQIYKNGFMGTRASNYTTKLKAKWDSIKNAYILQGFKLSRNYGYDEEIESSEDCWNMCKSYRRCLTSMHRSSDNTCLLYDSVMSIEYEGNSNSYFFKNNYDFENFIALD